MLRKTLYLSALVALTALVGGVIAPPASADGFIRIRRRPRQPRNVPLSVKWHKVNVSVKGQTATTMIDQVFHNPNNRVLEGTYMFPLPESAAIDDFILYINGKPVKAELLDRKKARDIYESIVRSQKDPALLEYVGREMFQASVFPIPARGDMRIKIQYQELLRRDAGLTTYRYPLNTEKFSSAPLSECAIEVSIESDAKLGTIVSPSHKIDVARTGDKAAKVSWEARNVTPDKDFYLYIGSAEAHGGMTLATHKGSDKEGTFLLSQIVFRRDEESARAQAKARAESIRRRILGGESFEAVATEVSDDPATAEKGGQLGEVPAEAIDPQYRAALDGLEPGDVSDVVEDPEGFVILRLNSKSGEREPSYDEAHDQLLAFLEQQKSKEFYDELVAQARTKTYVEIRLDGPES